MSRQVWAQGGTLRKADIPIASQRHGGNPTASWEPALSILDAGQCFIDLPFGTPSKFHFLACPWTDPLLGSQNDL